jgi:hypothetical protein
VKIFHIQTVRVINGTVPFTNTDDLGTKKKFMLVQSVNYPLHSISLPVVGEKLGDIVTDVTKPLYDNTGTLHLAIQSSLLLDLGIGQEFTNTIKKHECVSAVVHLEWLNALPVVDPQPSRFGTSADTSLRQRLTRDTPSGIDVAGVELPVSIHDPRHFTGSST